MQKKPRFTFVKMLVLFLACYPLALVLEGFTGWRTPGAFIAGAAVRGFGDGGLSNLKYLPLLVAIDTVFCFVILLIVDRGLRHLLKLDSEPSNSPTDDRTTKARGFALIALMLFGGLTSARAQQPLLQIVSPADQTQATHGQTITISVPSDPRARKFAQRKFHSSRRGGR